jgi:hypothetical protein
LALPLELWPRSRFQDKMPLRQTVQSLSSLSPL